VHVTWSAPTGTGVNADAPFHVRWRESDGLAEVPAAMDARGAEVEAGFDVVLNDVSADRLKSGMATINGNLSRQVFKKIITEDARKQALERIAPTETMDGLADCDLVVESAVEKEEVKRKIFHDLCAVLKPTAIVAGPDGNLYVASAGSNSVLRFNATTGAPLPAAGQSGATFVAAGSGGLSSPAGLTFGQDLNLYVTNKGTNSILRFNGTTGVPLPASGQ